MRHLVSPVPSTLTFLAVMATLHPTPAGAAGPIRVVVRVSDGTPLPADALEAALTHATWLLSTVSVDLAFRRCGPFGPVDFGCDEVLTGDEVVLRIARSPEPHPGRQPVPLGQALVDHTRGRGVLATVYIDPIVQLARASGGADGTMLLGRAIAHELGHLLMATTDHDGRGLMRAAWSADELRRGRASDWTFAPRDAAVIRAHAHQAADVSACDAFAR
jgi:hypothetical protein